MGVEKEKDTSALFGVVLEVGVVGCGVLELMVSAGFLIVVIVVVIVVGVGMEMMMVVGLVVAIIVAVVFFLMAPCSHSQDFNKKQCEVEGWHRHGKSAERLVLASVPPSTASPLPPR